VQGETFARLRDSIAAKRKFSTFQKLALKSEKTVDRDYNGNWWVPMVKGRVDQKASTATGYGWLVWENERLAKTRLVWIPPCRKLLERDGDYRQAPHRPIHMPITFY
jgi:hypothetical protein